MRDESEPVAADATDRVIWALRRAEGSVQTLKERQLRPLGMAPAHYSLLISVHSAPGITGAELARRLNVTPQSVASLVARLTEKGQLERRPHPLHRHVQELNLTDAGREALKSADVVIESIEQQITTHLSPDNAARLTALLNEVVAAVRDAES